MGKPNKSTLDDIWARGTLSHLPKPNVCRRISAVLFDNVEIIDVTGPLSAFALVNEFIETESRDLPLAYECELISNSTGPVRTSPGVRMVADRAFRQLRGPIDTLIIPGGPDEAVWQACTDQALLATVRRWAPRVRRIASVCTGALILAESGVLKGRTVTTHHGLCETLQNEHPDLTVDPDSLYVRDGHVYTSAGMTAGIDLALSMIEEDWGRDWALEISRSMVVYLKRPGGQSQFSSPLRAQINDSKALKGIPNWIVDNLGENLSVSALADRAGMSPRNFSRVFRSELKTTPAKFVERARLEAVRRRLEETQVSLEMIARDTGFGTGERMRRAFQRRYSVNPEDYRVRFSK